MICVLTHGTLGTRSAHEAWFNAMPCSLGTWAMGTCMFGSVNKACVHLTRAAVSHEPRRSVIAYIAALTTCHAAVASVSELLPHVPTSCDEAVCRSASWLVASTSCVTCTRRARCAHTTLSCSRCGTKAGVLLKLEFCRKGWMGLCDCYAGCVDCGGMMYAGSDGRAAVIWAWRSDSQSSKVTV